MDPTELAVALFRIFETADPILATKVVAPDNYNSEAVNGPLACQIPGPAGTLASGAWLRSAYQDLRFQIERTTGSGDQIWTRLRMQGQHTGAFVRFQGGEPDQVIPPPGAKLTSNRST